jgi:hypothetical protein
VQDFSYEFLSKLWRFTNNAFPDKIPVSKFLYYYTPGLHYKKDRYRELMHVSRIWRDLVNRKRFGFEHETDRSPRPGDLALYCPACPQPGINLPVSWKDSYDEYVKLLSIGNLANFSYVSWLVMQRYVVDGNFTAQHMKMKTPDDDVLLADGMGYMVTEWPYQTHVAESAEEKEVSYDFPLHFSLPISSNINSEIILQ